MGRSGMAGYSVVLDAVFGWRGQSLSFKHLLSRDDEADRPQNLTGKSARTRASCR